MKIDLTEKKSITFSLPFVSPAGIVTGLWKGVNVWFLFYDKVIMNNSQLNDK